MKGWTAAIIVAVLAAAVAVAAEQPTPTSTRTRTCTPGSNPAPGCSYEGPTFTMTPQPTPTPPLAPGGLLVVGSARRHAGESVTIDVTLITEGQQITAVQHDITFDSTGVVIEGPTACLINPSISQDAPGCSEDPNSGPCKRLELTLDDVGDGKRRLRALVLSLQNSTLIPDGPLYSCTFRIANDAAVGGVFPLECSLPQSTGPEPVVPIRCYSGAIEVCDCGPIVTPSPTRSPTRTPAEFFPTCCKGEDGCRDPRQVHPFLCLGFAERGFGAPYICSMAFGKCLRPYDGSPCTGDCNGDGAIRVDEILRGVNILLDRQPLDDCRAMDGDNSVSISVADLVQAVIGAIEGCPDGAN